MQPTSGPQRGGRRATARRSDVEGPLRSVTDCRVVRSGARIATAARDETYL